MKYFCYCGKVTLNQVPIIFFIEPESPSNMQSRFETYSLRFMKRKNVVFA